MKIHPKWRDFLIHVNELQDLESARALLEFDWQTSLPERAAGGRAAQLETLSALIHQHSVSKKAGNLLAAVEKIEFAPDSFEARLRRRVRRDFEHSRKLPAALVRKWSRAGGRGFTAWSKARQANDFRHFAPSLAELVELARQRAACFAPYRHLYDPLLDQYEEGLTEDKLAPVFTRLRTRLAPIVRELAARGVDDQVLQLPVGRAKQLALGRLIGAKIGYDFSQGVMAESVHPFSTTIGPSDVRITTHVSAEHPFSALFSTIHECGHAIYEQNIDPALARTPLGQGASLAWHESQSRFFENMVARSAAFWRFAFPQIRKLGPAFAAADEAGFVAAVNRVTPSLIRTEADEVTYNLHIILRHELETGLLEDRFKVAELPELWRAKMAEYLGVTVPDDRHGVLQDIHWSDGSFGYFPTYALGNLLAARVRERAYLAIPDLDERIGRGSFAELGAFLRHEIHRFGGSLTPSELAIRLFGSDEIDEKPFLNYLGKKFGLQ